MCNVYPAIVDMILTCPCCELLVDELAKSYFCNVPICPDCFYIWYDQGVTDSAKIKAIRHAKLRTTA